MAPTFSTVLEGVLDPVLGASAVVPQPESTREREVKITSNRAE
ncbi:hypothetical protein UF75_0122 [Desulfosporosinus sp. I2]|nr:hypothetical protein UF75_0122 [Desulfosporosinus sp. I2]